MNTKYLFFILIIVLSLALNGCSNGKLDDYTGIAKDGNTLKGLEVSYSTWDDADFGGDGAIAISLIIKNESSSSIDNCTIIINGRYKASLKDIEYYYGFKKGNQPMERSFIKARETLSLSFSHDNNNHLIFRDDEKIFPRTDIIDELTIVSDQGTCSWNFKTKSKK